MIPGGILINVYLLEVLPSSDLSIFPACAGPSDMVGGIAVMACSPPSTRLPPLRIQSWRAISAGKFLFMADILMDPAAPTSEEDLARQVIKSIQFY